MPLFKPMLAPTEPIDISRLTFPVYASPKLDGVRATTQVCDPPNPSILLARSLKPIPNNHIRSLLSIMPVGFDGEITTGMDFHESSGNIRRVDSESDFNYSVFDFYHPTKGYLDRIEEMQKHFDDLPNNLKSIVVPIIPIKCNNVEELKALNSNWVSQGYEGSIVRTANSPYKQGRATLRENYMFKVKDFLDTEAVIVDCYELMHNNNEAKINELGRTERSSNKENLVPSGILGGFVLKSKLFSEEFRCGSFKNVTHEERKALWENRTSLIGKVVKFKFQPHGSVDRPRIPIFLGFRDDFDTSAD
jgi:DNA ligase-1